MLSTSALGENFTDWAAVHGGGPARELDGLIETAHRAPPAGCRKRNERDARQDECGHNCAERIEIRSFAAFHGHDRTAKNPIVRACRANEDGSQRLADPGG